MREWFHSLIGGALIAAAVLVSGFGKSSATCPPSGTVKHQAVPPAETRTEKVVIVDAKGNERLSLYADGDKVKLVTGGRVIDVTSLARRLGDRE